jgi:hypothetical protein
MMAKDGGLAKMWPPRFAISPTGLLRSDMNRERRVNLSSMACYAFFSPTADSCNSLQ